MRTPSHRILPRLILAAACVAGLAGIVWAQNKPTGVDAAAVQLQSLRHGSPITEELPITPARQERDSSPLDRDYMQQPPLIPHTIEGYQITKNYNKCMDCHAFSKARQSGATRVSVTHFLNRDGMELDNVSPRRYFCTACHVPQTDAKPLMDNTFQRARGLQ